jgi:hypothetical protein
MKCAPNAHIEPHMGVDTSGPQAKAHMVLIADARASVRSEMGWSGDNERVELGSKISSRDRRSTQKALANSSQQVSLAPPEQVSRPEG